MTINGLLIKGPFATDVRGTVNLSIYLSREINISIWLQEQCRARVLVLGVESGERKADNRQGKALAPLHLQSTDLLERR